MRINIKVSPCFLQLQDHEHEFAVDQNQSQQLRTQLEKYILRSQNFAQSKDEMQNLQLIENLRLEKEKDYIVRMSQIIDTFQLSPINLTICHSSKQTLIKAIIFQNQQTIKETEILLAKNYETICYKSKLYGISSIILKKYPSSNFIEDYFDLVAFSHKGEVLCTFHNFKKIERLVKAVQIRFRRVSTIFYIQNVCKQDLKIDWFLELKKFLKAKVIGIYQFFTSSQQHSMKQQSLGKSKIIVPQISINCSTKTLQQFNLFCYSHFIAFLQQKQQQHYSTYFKNQLCLTLCQQMCKKVQKKQQFNNFVLGHICYEDKKRQQYRMRNQITIRLINYCYDKVFGEENVTIGKLKNVMQQLVNQVEEIRIKLKKSDEENKSTLMYKHFPRLMIKGSRLCFHCKQKSKYLCIGCSVKHSTKVALCVLCFAPFHEEKTYYEHFPRIIKKSNCKFIQNLQKEVNSGHKFNSDSSQSRASKKRNNAGQIRSSQEAEKIQCEKNQLNNERITKKVKLQSKRIIKKYQQSKKFVFSCYQQVNFNKKQPQQEANSCKIQHQ